MLPRAATDRGASTGDVLRTSFRPRPPVRPIGMACGRQSAVRGRIRRSKSAPMRRRRSRIRSAIANHFSPIRAS